MYTLFSKVQKSVLAKALGVLMIVALMFPAAAVAPLAFAEGEETTAPEVVVEAAPAVEVVSDVAPQQSVDDSDKKVEEEIKDEVKDENPESVKGDEVISDVTVATDESATIKEDGKVLGDIKVDGGAGPTCPAQTMTVKSGVLVGDDTETFNAGANNAVPTWVSPLWTTVFTPGGAQWIWDALHVSDPVNGQTQTFTRTFTLPGVAQTATLKIATDDSYKISINSNVDMFVDTDGDSFLSPDIYTGDIAVGVPADLVDALNQGGNTFKFEVKNAAEVGGTSESNPAGLIYELEINYIPTKCDGDSKDGTITVTKVVANSNEPVSSFPLFVNGTPVISGVASTFGSGVYNVTETNMPNYEATFSGACDSKGEITLNKGASVNCTITNTYVPPITTGAYCGDGEVNQEWEQCDGNGQCTAQCQFDNQCTDKVFAKVTIDEGHYKNIGGASGMTSDIFVGGNAPANKIPSGTWFLISDGVTPPIVDDPNAGYLDVPGLAVERRNGEVFLGIYGGYASGHDLEHVDGKLEFSNATVTGQTTQTTNPKIEQGFTNGGFGGTSDTNDEVRITGGVSEFSMTTNHHADGFETQYTITPAHCSTTITVIKKVTNDEQGTKTPSDFTMHLTGTAIGTAEVFPGSSLGTTFEVDPGNYSVWESAGFGGYTGSMENCSGTIALGEHKICTVTNNDTHYTAFCGDNILNQPWEQCDGGAQCTAQCQNADQCTDKAFAQVSATIHDTNIPQQLTTDVYVGGTNANALILPTGTWFEIFDGTNYIIDNRTNGSQFFNVPGIAVQRITAGGKRLLTGIYGQNNTDKTTIKHAQGTVKFFNTGATSLIEGPGSMHMEQGFNGNGFGGYNHSDDEVRIPVSTNYAEFSLSTNSQGDAFGTLYSTPQSCDDDGGTDGGTTGQGGTGDDGSDDTGGTTSATGGTTAGTTSGTTGDTTGSGSTGGGTNGGQGGGGTGSGGSGGAVLIPSNPVVGSVLGATTDVGAGGGGDNGQVLGDSLAQTGMPLSFPMLLSVILAIATLIVTRKEKFV